MHARSLATGAGLSNLELREASFQESAREAREGQQDVDVILSHCILSWVNKAARNAIVEIALKRLNPGGSNAGVLQLYAWVDHTVAAAPNLADKQMSAALEFLDSLRTRVARYFKDNATLTPLLECIQKNSLNYLVHEFMHENSEIYHFADLAALLSGAKLTFLCSASIPANSTRLTIPKPLLPLLTIRRT